MEEPTGVSHYDRKDVLRIFGIREQQLRLWERNGLIACSQNYSFQELGQLRKLRDLGAQRISAGSIRTAVSAMRSVSGLTEPLTEAGLDIETGNSRRLAFRHSGAIMEPIAGQYLFDFSGNGKRGIAAITVPLLSARERDLKIQQLFTLAVRAEESGAMDEALLGYETVLEIAPGHPATAINMGTICYNRRDYARAEQFYRMATESDPDYALAFFDLGNVLDELKRLPEAITAYRRAIELHPRYADAHYNLALAMERNGQRRSALRHWTLYLRLDGSGTWAQHARNQMRKTLASLGLELLPGEAPPRSARRRKEDQAALVPRLRVV